MNKHPIILETFRNNALYKLLSEKTNEIYLPVEGITEEQFSPSSILHTLEYKNSLVIGSPISLC